MQRNKETLNRIRSVIKKTCGVDSHADKINISRTTLYNFLNGQTNIQFDTLEKIIRPLGMDILQDLPSNLKQYDCVRYEGEAVKVGSQVNGKKVLLCFGSPSSSHEMIVVEDGDGNKEVMIF